MLSNNDTVDLAAAGSGKTTSIITDALSDSSKRILITTYTNENLDNIRSEIYRINGFIPDNIDVMSWYTFLLRHCVRPYQNSMGQAVRIKSVNFEYPPSRFVTRTNLNYYIDKGNHIYSARASDFACCCNETTQGQMITRLENIYDVIFIDEGQDLCGYDLELIELILSSKTTVKMVADPRQATYSTSRSQKNRQFRGSKIADWFEKLESDGKLTIIHKSESYRCNQAICDYADALYPALPTTTSKNTKLTGNDGIFFINRCDVPAYVVKHNPVILRHDIRTDTLGYPAINFGASKGRSYYHVLIFPTNPIKKYLADGVTGNLKDQARSKFYVAVTRARFSVAFVVD